MSLEASHEHTEQELPGSTASANANYNPIVQDNNDGDQFPAIVIPSDDQEEAIHQSFQDPITLHDAAKVAFRQYWTNGQVANLNRAVECWHEALKLTPTNSPNRPALQNNLGIGLRDRYTHTGNLTDLDAAIDFIQQAVQATPSDSPDRPARLSNLTIGLRDRYVRTGDQNDLEAAIDASQQAVQATPANSPDWSKWQNNLGMILCDRYTYTGDLDDLEAAIAAFVQAVQAVPSDSPDRPTRMSNLGAGLHDRYIRTGNLIDLEAAITAFQQAVQATPSNSSDLPGYLSNLGAGLRSRYTRTGSLTDLGAAIDAFQQAVQATPSNSLARPTLLNNLGNGLSDLYKHTGNLTNLGEAIDAFQQAVQATPSNSPDKSRWQNSLGIGLRDRYTRTRNLTDLEAASTAFQQAVQATPSDSPERSARQNNLAIGLYDRYICTGNLTDLEAAITAFQQVGQTIPFDSPERSTWLSNLGIGLHERYVQTGNLTDLEEAIMAWERSWSLPDLRFAALPVTYQLGQQLQGAGIAARLVTAYLEQAKQRHPRSSNAPRRALEIAEGSKSRLLTQLVGRGLLPAPEGLSPEVVIQEQQFLTDLTDLDTQELASHHYFASPQREESSPFSRLQQRQTTLRALEDLWDRIADIGPEGVAYVALRRGASLTWQEFVSLAKALGPATVLLSFFTTADRTLLFLMRAGWRAPRMVEIPLKQADRTDLAERFFREVHRREVSPHQTGQVDPVERSFRVYQDESDHHLSETWDQPLIPLFTRARRYLEGIERLILAPNSIGHLLPWGVLAERAGCYTATRQPLPVITLPALGILSRLRQRPHVPPGSVLVVGNPRGDLPHAEAEANMVAHLFKTKPLLRTDATKSAVLTRFSDATLIHLATHAFFEAENPLESYIVLADGVLTVREVLQHRLQTDLLVLSACESGRVGSLGGEELAGFSQAFLQAGARSLLVSLWPVNDPATAAFIQAFYTARQTGVDKALALRQAMTRIQQDPRWTHPYYWGAFILVGDWD